MDKNSKRLLEFVKDNQDHPDMYFFTFEEFLPAYEEYCGSSEEETLACIRYLVEIGYLEYKKIRIRGEARNAGIQLSHKGFNSREFNKIEIWNYIKSKWIDFIALIVAIAAFILSCIALGST